jgi:colanic acid biosynthesis glycosyl transferase WcaI
MELRSGRMTKRIDLLVIDYGAYQFSADLAGEFAREETAIVSYRYPSPVPTPNSRSVQLSEKLFDARPIFLTKEFERYGWKRIFSELDLGIRSSIVVLRTRPRRLISANMPIFAQLGIWSSARLTGGHFTFWLQDIFGVAGKTLPAGSGTLAHLSGAVGYVERFLLRRADRVIAISPSFATWLVSIGVSADRIVMQPNWCDPTQISPSDCAPSAEVFGAGGRVFLYTGTVGLKHDVGLLAGLAVVLEKAGARLIVVSEGPGADVLRTKAGATVLPFQDSASHATMLASADVLVVSLRSQAGEFSVPSKVNAYLCAGRPILAALPRANLAANILAGVHCSVSSPDDPVSFYVAATRLAEAATGDLEEIGRRCREYAVREFDTRRISNRVTSNTKGSATLSDALVSEPGLREMR